jgi:hypothetical protein
MQRVVRAPYGSVCKADFRDPWDQGGQHGFRLLSGDHLAKALMHPEPVRSPIHRPPKTTDRLNVLFSLVELLHDACISQQQHLFS